MNAAVAIASTSRARQAAQRLLDEATILSGRRPAWILSTAVQLLVDAMLDCDFDGAILEGLARGLGAALAKGCGDDEHKAAAALAEIAELAGVVTREARQALHDRRVGCHA